MQKKRILITGSAGFIGNHIAKKLSEKYETIGIDNFSNGKLKNIPTINADLFFDNCEQHFAGIDTVFHFAANPDVKLGATDTKVHIEQNIIVTHNVLEAMRKNGVKKIVFASSSTVYGNAAKMPTPEDYAPMNPVSLYGASKLSCEALISAYCNLFGMQAWIFRLANIIGKESDHGIIPDFIKKLNANPKSLEILGNGKQNKSYLHIDDCVNGIITGFEKSKSNLNIFNLGSDSQASVVEIADTVCNEMGVSPKYIFSGGKEGWLGDVPVMILDSSKLKSYGWKPQYSSKEAVKKTASDIVSQD